MKLLCQWRKNRA